MFFGTAGVAASLIALRAIEGKLQMASEAGADTKRGP
jgi:hypothetical protein